MRKKLEDLVGCLCEQEKDTEVFLASGDYTDLEATKTKYGLELVAWGEGTAYYRPKYCPFCGKKM